MEAKGGRTLYGHAIGFIMLDTRFARIPGDVGNATTWSFPVLYRTVRGATSQRVVRERAEGLLEPFVEAAHELARDGVRAISTSCGFLAVYQKQIAAEIPVPVFTSSLMQIPLVYRMLRPEQKVGVIAVDSRYLSEDILREVGADGVPIAKAGTEAEEELTRVLIDGKEDLDVTKAEADMIRVSKRLVEQNPDVGAIVLECTNMPPYARSVSRATSLPVFDIVNLTNYVYRSLMPEPFLTRA